MNRFTTTILFFVTLAFLFESTHVLVSVDLCIHRYAEQEDVKCADAKDLTQLTFTNTNFSAINWTDGKKEFELNNKRFDVAAIKYFFNRVVVFAKLDGKEDALLSLLNNFHKNAGKNIRLLKFHKNIIPDSNDFLMYCGVISEIKTQYYLCSVCAEPVNFFSPPPNYS